MRYTRTFNTPSQPLLIVLAGRDAIGVMGALGSRIYAQFPRIVASPTDLIDTLDEIESILGHSEETLIMAIKGAGGGSVHEMMRFAGKHPTWQVEWHPYELANAHQDSARPDGTQANVWVCPVIRSTRKP